MQGEPTGRLRCLLGVFFGPISTAIAEQFVARSRSTGLGIAYNLAVMIFGGFAQFFVTWLIEATGSPIARIDPLASNRPPNHSAMIICSCRC